MKKVYMDLALAALCIYLIVKYTVPFLLMVVVLAVVWFFVLDDKRRKEIKDRIAEFYR